jgi:hypothetical protein
VAGMWRGNRTKWRGIGGADRKAVVPVVLPEAERRGLLLSYVKYRQETSLYVVENGLYSVHRLDAVTR